ncbi:proton pump complex quinol oxidase subunit SoxB [Acidianus sp. HS-5]|uniref:proton pump complex quinol oxidase subunit SoxB n=1 Tax=Acidianus sp. HS-5 TaxID=2886040 RepID=UPI001F021F15|nr:proton pump complex quinol oxidase subunit SoxB [Acidianus sp. HS-5]BDC17772.1 cytochrome b6 [Acidianus sp. HS-5]
MKLYPKSTVGVALMYTGGALAWLAVLGIAALWFRTILLSPHICCPKIGENVISPLYYFLVTMHGQIGMFIVVPDLTLAAAAYGLYKSKMNILHFKIMTIAFWLINLPLIFAFAGQPTTGWYEYPPLSLQTGTWIVYGAMHDAKLLIGLGYFMQVINTIGAIIGGLTLFFDGYKTRPREGKIPIFAAYGMAFGGMFMPITIVALTGAALWYSLYFWFGVPVNPLTWVVLFWFYGHPVVYYVPFTVFGGLYVLIPHYAGRPLYSERWARWNIALLFTFGMLAWVHHLQTWPLPVAIRAFITPTTLILAAGSGLTVLNLGLTIFTGKGYNWKNPIGMASLIALIGFILGGIQALMLPENPLNILVHNTYYIVGHFHMMIWTIIIIGFTAILLDMLKAKMGNADFSNLGRGLLTAGLMMWTSSALALGYVMSYAGYNGLVRRWDAYPLQYLPYMDAMTYLAVTMAASFVMFAIPILVTLLPIKTSAFWVSTEAPSLPSTSLPGTMAKHDK